MGRSAKGSVRWNEARKAWIVRVTRADGSRAPIAMTGLPPCAIAPTEPSRGCTCAPCVDALEKGRDVSDRMRGGGFVGADVVETASEWFKRYVRLHGQLGNGIAQHPGDWRKHVEVVIGTKQMTEITIADVKEMRDRLTRARLAGRMRAKRAMNIWSTVVKAPFSRAWTDDDPKYSSVHVGPASGNPATGVRPPVSVSDRYEDERERQALEPEEATDLLACKAIPIPTRRLYAWSMLAGLRPSELYALTWADVRAKAIKVRGSLNLKTDKAASTKTRASVRDVPIHPHLAPLVATMRGEATERVFPLERVRDTEDHARVLREHLRLAGITRPELHEGTETLIAFDVRSFRTCFATWCARSRFDSAWIDVWLGHAPKTTAAKHYVKDTGELTAGVFPSLPPDLQNSGPSGPISAGGRPNASELLKATMCEGRDLNPYRSYPTGT